MPRFVTASLKVDYRSPTPVGKEVELRATVEEIKGRKVVISSTVAAEGDTVAVGATNGNNANLPSNSGSVHIFERNQGGPGNFGQVAEVVGSQGAGGGVEDHRDPVGALHEFLEFRGDQQHADALFHIFPDDRLDLELGAHIDAAGRLVEKQYPAPRRKPSGQHHLLLIAPGQGFDRSVGFAPNAKL